MLSDEGEASESKLSMSTANETLSDQTELDLAQPPRKKGKKHKKKEKNEPSIFKCINVQTHFFPYFKELQ